VGEVPANKKRSARHDSLGTPEVNIRLLTLTRRPEDARTTASESEKFRRIRNPRVIEGNPTTKACVRLVPTRANGQPAYGCYVLDGHARIARAGGLIVLQGARSGAITDFANASVFRSFGLPRMLQQ
jgi:hypothetical protein